MPIIDLMSELPYAAALTADFIPERCLFCFQPKNLTAGACRCHRCGVVVYCNETCMQRDAFEHEPECRAYRNFRVAQRPVIDDANAAYGDEKLRLLARLIRRHRRDGGNVDLTIDRPPEVKVRRLSDLMSHREDLLRDPIRSIHLQDYASDLYGFFANTTEEFSPLYTTVDQIEEYVGKMCINCFGVPVTTADDETHIGVAVYLTSSRFDHSCKPNLCMDFEGNRIVYRYFYENEQDRTPDYDTSKMTVSYGYAPTYAGFSAMPTRQQRQLSLATRYYFVCACRWCSEERDAELSEAATTRLCKSCGEPFVFQPDHVKGFILRQTCACPKDDGPFMDVFEDGAASSDLDKLLKEWSTTFHPSENFQSATDAITKVEPLRRLAHRYWHPVLNLRYVQLNEALFHAYRSIALSGCPTSFSASPTIFPIPESSRTTADSRARAAIAGCIAGEMTVTAYQKRLEPYETVVARFCFQLAELYELRKNTSGALTNYERALEIWRYHGSRGEQQIKVIESRLSKLLKEAAERSGPVEAITHGVKSVRVADSNDEPKNDAEKDAVKEKDAKRTQTAGKKKNKNRRK